MDTKFDWQFPLIEITMSIIIYYDRFNLSRDDQNPVQWIKCAHTGWKQSLAFIDI